MQVTAEIRWFWSVPQAELKDWFTNSNIHDYPAGGGGTRIDSYLLDPRQVELGLKHRGGRKGVEIKGLVAVTAGGCTVKPFDGDIEIWTKWTSSTLSLDMTKTVTTEKQRWLRKFDTRSGQAIEIKLDERESPVGKMPEKGCGIELTKVRFLDHETHEALHDEIWWTLSFESFGKLEDVKESLRITAETLSRRNPPAFDKNCHASYPEWLSQHAQISAVR